MKWQNYFLMLNLLSNYSEDEAVKVADSLMNDISIEQFEQCITQLRESDLPFRQIGHFVEQLIKRIRIIDNNSMKLELSSKIIEIESTRLTSRIAALCRELYVECLELNGYFIEAGKYRKTWPEYENETDILKHILAIADDFYKGNDNEEAYARICEVRSRIFRRNTPLEIVRKFDEIYGDTCFKKGLYLDSAHAYFYLYQNTGDREYLKKACISALAAPLSNARIRLLTKIYDIPGILQLNIYWFLKHILEMKFINKILKEELKRQLQDTVDDSSIFDLSCMQHNIYIVKRIYDRVSIKRLAELLGETHDSIKEQLITLIRNGTIKATIDHVTNVVQFHEVDDSRNDSIFMFCGNVARLAADIQIQTK